MEFNTLYSIKPKNYNNCFSLPPSKNNKIIFRNIFSYDNNKKSINSNNYISQNKLQEPYNINSFNFYKTDIVPFPKFPKIKKIHRFNKIRLLTKKTQKKKNIFSIKYLELIKDINNEKVFKNYYFLKANNKDKNRNNHNENLIKIIFNNDIDTLRKGINSLNKLKNMISENMNNPQDIIKKIYKEDKIYINTEHNIFFKDILNNINRQIELYKIQNNQVDIIFVKNLLVNELNKLENNFSQIKKDIKQFIKVNIINKAINTISPSKVFSLSSSSSSSKEKNNKKNLKHKYLQILIKNSKSTRGQAKNFQSGYNSVPSSFNFTKKKNNNNLSLSQTYTNSNKRENKISNFKIDITNNNITIKNKNKASELIKEISNKIEKKFGTTYNRYFKRNMKFQNLFQRHANTSRTSNEPKKLEDKNINTDLNNNNYFKNNSKNIFINHHTNKKKNIQDIIKNTQIIPNKDFEKSLSPIIRKEKSGESLKTQKVEIDNNTNSNNLSSLENNNLIVENAIKEKEEKIDSQNENKTELKNSIYKLFEEIKNNETVKKKKIKKPVNTNEKHLEKKKTSKFKYESKLSRIIENRQTTEKKDKIKIHDSIKENTNKNNIVKKIKISPIKMLNKEEILEEVDLVRKEILNPKNLSVKKKDIQQQKEVKVNKKELKDIRNKLIIIKNINDMNFNEKEKEILLSNIFSYKIMLNKYPKTKEDLLREEEIKERIKVIIEKYLYELQISELVNTKSIFSRKKQLINKKLSFFKKLNILEEDKIKEIEEKILNAKMNTNQDKSEKIIKTEDEKDKEEKRKRRKYTKIKFKGEVKLIYDNSYLFKKNKKKKEKEIKDEVRKILNTNYALSDKNKSSSSLINESFYSVKNKKVKTKYNTKSKMISRKNSIYSCIGDTFNTRFMEKIDEEEILRREEEIRRKKREIEEKRRKEELLDKKLYNFFEKIKKMKNNDIEYQDELEKLINEHSNNIDNNKEIRINSFIHKLELNREKEKFFVKFKNRMLGYTSPLVFTMNNFYSKSNDIFENDKNEDKYNRTVYNSKTEK